MSTLWFLWSPWWEGWRFCPLKSSHGWLSAGRLVVGGWWWGSDSPCQSIPAHLDALTFSNGWAIFFQGVGGYVGIHLQSPRVTPLSASRHFHLCIGVKLQGICLENVGKIPRCFGKTQEKVGMFFHHFFDSYYPWVKIKVVLELGDSPWKICLKLFCLAGLNDLLRMSSYSLVTILVLASKCDMNWIQLPRVPLGWTNWLLIALWKCKLTPERRNGNHTSLNDSKCGVTVSDMSKLPVVLVLFSSHHVKLSKSGLKNTMSPDWSAWKASGCFQK